MLQQQQAPCIDSVCCMERLHTTPTSPHLTSPARLPAFTKQGIVNAVQNVRCTAMTVI